MGFSISLFATTDPIPPAVCRQPVSSSPVLGFGGSWSNIHVLDALTTLANNIHHSPPSSSPPLSNRPTPTWAWASRKWTSPANKTKTKTQSLLYACCCLQVSSISSVELVASTSKQAGKQARNVPLQLVIGGWANSQDSPSAFSAFVSLRGHREATMLT